MSKRDITLLLLDIFEAGQKIKSYTSGLSHSDFINDAKTIDACVRNFEIIGEASARINPEFKFQHKNIEWHHLTGLRNRVIHEYFGVDYNILWDIIQDELESLLIEIEILIKIYNK